MNTKYALEEAIKIIGLSNIQKTLGITYQAVRLWQKNNRMPHTEYSGGTYHSKKIEEVTDGKVTISMLLGYVPPHLVKSSDQAESIRSSK